MKKMLLCFFTVLLVALIPMSGCSKIDIDNSSDSTLGRQRDTPHQSAQQPHDFSDFKGPGSEFKGGQAVNDYSLTLVRRVNHPEFIRLVFEFAGKVDDKEEAPPEYTVSMENEKKISIRLKGVIKEEVMENKTDILSLSELLQDVDFTRDANGEAVVSLSFNGPVVFQVFDLAKPARVVLVLRPTMGQMNKI